MKKKKIFMMIVIFVILSFIIVTLVLKKKEQDTAIIGELIYNSWEKYRDEFFRTKNVDFEIPTLYTSILFGEKTVEFCVPYELEEGEVFEEDVVSKSICTKYDYSVTSKKFNVIIDGKEVAYDYKFNEDEQLVLTLTGDGYEYNMYYNKNAG